MTQNTQSLTFRCEFDVVSDLVLPGDAKPLSLRDQEGFETKLCNAPKNAKNEVPGLYHCCRPLIKPFRIPFTERDMRWQLNWTC